MNTILFDLDGTVLPLDTDYFMKIYFQEIEKAFEGFEDRDSLVKNLWSATSEMIKIKDNRTNEQVFFDAFDKLIAGDLQEYLEIFDKFYDTGFLKTKMAIVDNENIWIKKSIKLLKEKGYTLVIATNPLFPIKAIHHRIRWSGFEPEDFVYITSYETNHYCKPQIEYYNEILENIGKKAEECMMVGNDAQEDMIAGQLGMETFLITNHLINREGNELVFDYKGDYEDFYGFVTKLPTV